MPDLAEYPNAVAVSATTGDGIQDLLQRLADIHRVSTVDIEVEIPYDDSRLVALFHEYGRVEEESFGQSGTRLRGAVPSALAGRFDAYRVEPATYR